MSTRRRTYYNMLGGLFDNMEFVNVIEDITYEDGLYYLGSEVMNKYSIDLNLPILMIGDLSSKKGKSYYMLGLNILFPYTISSKIPTPMFTDGNYYVTVSNSSDKLIFSLNEFSENPGSCNLFMTNVDASVLD